MLLRGDRQGVIIVLVAVLLIGLLLFVGFSVDFARMMLARTELRVVADLSAKAAAGELSRTQDLDMAKAAAQELAIRSHVVGKELTLDDQDIVFGHSTRQPNGTWTFQAGETPLNSVSVTARRTRDSADGAVKLFFGKLYDRTDFETQFSAISSFVDVDICLVLDRSSSMKLPVSSNARGMSTSAQNFCKSPRPNSRWVALDNAIDLFVGHLTATSATERVAVVTFASDYTSRCGETNLAASVDQKLSGDLSLVNAAMADRSNSVWNGATDIAAGINVGRAVLTGPDSRIYATKVMILLTDGVYSGGDPVSQATLARDDGISVHTITFGKGANQTDMWVVARVGGGNHYHAPDADALSDIFAQIAALVTMLTE